MRKFYRSRTDRMIAGVAGGLGAYLGVDPTLVRLAFLGLTLGGGGLGLMIYLLMAIIVPLEPAPGAAKVEAGDEYAHPASATEETRRAAQLSQVAEPQR